ncbi:methyltransferase domain-containing protein [Armatimonas rosea]|uniref:methyltransferase domain-containing protein n=1 Tax=Armatimonas rosea TaxID=685828 RepID=UPI001613CFEA
MWDDRYEQDEYAYGTSPNDFLASVVERIPAGRILCLCEGEGRNGVFLAERGFSVTGVDGSAKGLQKAQALAVQRGVTIETIVADLAHFEIEPNAWDGIVSIFAHLPPLLRQRIHRQAVEGLRPGGAFVLEAYTPAQVGRGTGGPQQAELTMPLAMLQQELTGLSFAIAHEQERDVHEGAFHSGTSAVVQVLAYKAAHGS